MTKFKEYFNLLLVPIGLLVVYLVMALLWKALGLPSDSVMIPLVKEYFNNYGIFIVFIGALIEGFFIVGQYFPGGFIIFLGVISSVGNIPRAVAVVSVTSLAFFIAYTLNYFVGKYGWYKVLLRFGLGHSIETSKEKLLRQGMNAIMFSYWEPNLASIIATSAGILNIPLKKFLIYSLSGIIVWNTFWGVLVYTLGENALKIIGVKYVLVIFGVWIIILLLKKIFSENSQSEARMFQKNKNIIFDWSGVVRDTVTNQLWIVNKIFEKYNVGKISPEEFMENWEQPPDVFYQKYLPRGYDEAGRSKLFQELQLDKECPKAYPFLEVVELIHKCKERGYFLSVVSSDFPETLLPEVEEYGLQNIFNEIVTDADDKFESVQRIIKENALDLQDTFFIGDSNHEIDVSRKVGIKSVAVTWGFTSEKKLKSKNPDYIVNNIKDLENIILA